MKNVNKERLYLDYDVSATSYTDVRDWVEDVVDGFNKGMKFDSFVDKKFNHKQASVILSPTRDAKAKAQKPYKTYRLAK